MKIVNQYTKAVLAVVISVLSTTVQAQTFDNFSDKYCRNLESNILFFDDAKTTLTLALQYQKSCEAGWDTLSCPFKSRDEADRWEDEQALNQKISQLKKLGITINPDDFAGSLTRLINASMDRWGRICK